MLPKQLLRLDCTSSSMFADFTGNCLSQLKKYSGVNIAQNELP